MIRRFFSLWKEVQESIIKSFSCSKAPLRVLICTIAFEMGLDCVDVTVEDAHRDAATLLPIIANHVKPGSIVYSDEWSAYNQLSATTGHIHRTVNHSLCFVDPATGAHPQGVEGMWSAWHVCSYLSMHSKLIDTYLPEFMWRRKFGGPVAFGHILKHISEQYPV